MGKERKMGDGRGVGGGREGIRVEGRLLDGMWWDRGWKSE